MAFRNKAHFILAKLPDILIVPECEHPDKLIFKDGTKIPEDIFWHGSNPNKGLGIFSYSNYKFKLLDCYNPELKTILPLLVTGGEIDFTLFAICAYNEDDKPNQYIGQVWKAIHHYDSILNDGKIILAGDFNSNKIWDQKHRKGNHSDVVDILKGKDICSTYHGYSNQEQGAEEHPTFYMYRHKDKPYHIDYIFASLDFMKSLVNVEVGEYNEWIQHSDHMPVMCSFK